MMVNLAMQEGSMVEGTVLKRTTKPGEKYPNNYNVQDNTNNIVIRDVNFDTINWFIDNEEDTEGENRDQLAEAEIHVVFATIVYMVPPV